MSYPISDVERRAQFSGSAGAGPYSFTFEILDESDIAVYVNDTLKTLTTHYTVTINGDGTGSITLVTPATGSDTVTILGARPIARTTDFVTGGDLLANSLNEELDSIIIMMQQLKETSDRTLRIVGSADITGVTFDLPAPNAGKALLWNATADALENSTDNFDTIVTSAAASASSASASASSASGSASAASASAIAAQTAQTNAETAETNAETAESNAAASAIAAAASAAAAEVAKIEWQGAWSGATAYALNDAVVYNGTSYICIQAHTNQAPPSATYWDVLALKGTDGTGAGDFSSNTSASVDGEIVLFSGTGGKTGKRATTTGLLKATSGVLAAATDGTDFLSSATGRKQGLETIWIPAGAITARTTNGAGSGTAETSTNKIMLKTLNFDQTTSEYAQFTVTFPKSWNEGTVTAQFYWSAASGSGTVTWGLQGVAVSDDDVLDAAFGSAQTVTDTLIATTDLHVTAATSAITIAGTPADADWTVFQVYRDIADTLNADARLHGVKLFYTTDAANDA